MLNLTDQLQKTLRDNEEDNSTEILPANWNENSTAYALRYVHDHKVYILLGTVANDTIILNLLVSETFTNTHFDWFPLC